MLSPNLCRPSWSWSCACCWASPAAWRCLGWTNRTLHQSWLALNRATSANQKTVIKSRDLSSPIRGRGIRASGLLNSPKHQSCGQRWVQTEQSKHLLSNLTSGTSRWVCRWCPLTDWSCSQWRRCWVPRSSLEGCKPGCQSCPRLSSGYCVELVSGDYLTSWPDQIWNSDPNPTTFMDISPSSSSSPGPPPWRCPWGRGSWGPWRWWSPWWALACRRWGSHLQWALSAAGREDPDEPSPGPGVCWCWHN